MLRQIKAIILIILLILSSFSTYAAAAAPKNAYSKTLEQIYMSRDVYKDTETRLSEFNKKYSSITYLFSAGKSVKGRDLSVIKVGNGARKIFINASHHPREYIGTILSLNQIQYLLEAYANNQTIDGCNVKKLLDNQVSFYFLPLVNPDGVQICVNGAPSYYFNANKVDLNHNYDANWFKKITSTYSTGSTAFSEPETQAVKALCETVEFDLTIAYHAAGDIIYWYYGQQGAAKTRDLAYANIIKKTTGYNLVGTQDYKSSTSGFKDWCVEKLKIPSFTIEVGGKRGISKPVEWSMYNSVWQKNRLIPVRIANQLLKQAKFNSDKKTALIYKNSFIHLNKNILLHNNESYISVQDAVSLGAAKQNSTLSYEINDNSLIINGTSYISITQLSEILGELYQYDSKTNTIYIL